MKNLIDFLNSTFGIESETSAPILISIIVFLLGITLQQILTAFSAYQKRKRIREIFQIALLEFSEQIKKQAVSFEKSVTSLSFEKTGPFQFGKSEILADISLTSLGYKETFEAFFTGFENLAKFKVNQKQKIFNSVWNTISGAKFWQEKAYSDIGEFINNYNLTNEKRNDELVKYQQLFEPIIINLNGKPIDPKHREEAAYIQELEIIRADWSKLKNRTRPDTCHRNLVLKTRILNRKNDEYQLSHQLNIILLAATNNYLNLRNLLWNTKSQFANYNLIFRHYHRICNLGKKI